MAVDPASLMSSKDFFELFFTDQVWQLLATQTNLYAFQKRGPEENSVWYPVSIEEMKAWLALYLCMGILNKPNIKSYWSTDPILSTPFFPATMSRTRFVQILRYLHFADNNHAPRPDSPDCNKLYKIQPVLDLVVPRFKAVYHPERELAVDEFIPSKPGRFGIKAFTLAESTSGYVLGSKVYTGKEAGVVQKDLGKKAVTSLMEPFLGKGYYLFMDNYYTSVGLFEELEERSTLACGTVRSNRVDLPREICNLKSRQGKQLKREVCISNAHILESKSLLHTTRNGLQFRRSLIDELTQQQSLQRDTRSPQNPIPQIRFNQGHFHHLVSHKKNIYMQSSPATCGYHIQLCSMWSAHVSRAMFSKVPHPEGLPLL
ncbi:piggyBac transposable element-derived protein 4-like [Montipora foliosa]|uniref:piggyBac transposable element-derived protein 4-like n=1 Tax=Montipora foliosa TaxID=591990 RepID=UPI0035F17532